MISQRLLSLLAESVHEATKVFSEQVLSEGKKEWSLLNEAQQRKIMEAVQRTIQQRIEDPVKAHEMWLEDMVKDGWRYGPEHNEEQKTHPCMLKYDALPAGQQTKDHLYLSILKPFYNI